MPKLKTGQTGGDGDVGELIPHEEIVAVTLADVEATVSTFKNDNTGKDEEVERLRWKFIVSDPGPYQGQMVSGMTSTAFVPHPNCKAYAWASALMGGKTFADNEVLDTDELVGRPARVLVKHKVGTDRTWVNVDSVLQARAGTSATDTPF